MAEIIKKKYVEHMFKIDYICFEQSFKIEKKIMGGT